MTRKKEQNISPQNNSRLQRRSKNLVHGTNHNYKKKEQKMYSWNKHNQRGNKKLGRGIYHDYNWEKNCPGHNDKEQKVSSWNDPRLRRRNKI
jgi:hypothetical protein